MNPLDYQSVDGILDKIEQVFARLSEKENHLEMQIERWRWDIPVIYVVWNGYDNISRNITALVLATSLPLGLMIEVNAWQDNDKGYQRKRYWEHRVIAEIKDFYSFETGETDFGEQPLWDVVYNKAYVSVSSWSTKQLTRFASQESLR